MIKNVNLGPFAQKTAKKLIGNAKRLLEKKAEELRKVANDMLNEIDDEMYDFDEMWPSSVASTENRQTVQENMIWEGECGTTWLPRHSRLFSTDKTWIPSVTPSKRGNTALVQ